MAVHKQGGAHARRCTPRVVHTKGESCYLNGVHAVGPRVEPKPGEAPGGLWVHRQGVAYICVVHAQEAVCGHRRSLVIQGGQGGLAPAPTRSEPKPRVVWFSTGKAVHTKGTSHQAWCTQKVSLVILGGCGGWPPHQGEARRSKGCSGGPQARHGIHVCGAPQRAVCGYRRSPVI